MLAPVATPPPEPPAKPKAKVRETEGKTAARDAKMTVRDEAVEAGGFVGLRGVVFEGGPPGRGTRTEGAGGEPAGEEGTGIPGVPGRLQQGVGGNHRQGGLP